MTTPLAPAKISSLIYGTAWKKAATTSLVTSALDSGFRAIDTAAQPKHYQEALVGEGIRQFLHTTKSGTTRRDLYIQTKYTSPAGQDPANLPDGYDPHASIADQVHASVASSLHNLRSVDDAGPNRSSPQSYIDCLVLHSPFATHAATTEAWRAMESHVPQHILSLGISNCYHLPTLQALYSSARVKPSVLQNRFYRETGYDAAIREFCRDKGIVYQSFWTLTANPELLRGEAVGRVARNVGVGKAVALYALVLGLPGRVSVLSGTTNVERMKEDLDGIETVEQWRGENKVGWKGMMETFEAELG